MRCLFAVVTCLGCTPRPVGPWVALAEALPPGLSGLTTSPAGWLAVTERPATLVWFDRDGSTRTAPVLGLPESADPEGITRIDVALYAISTEALQARSSDRVYWLTVDGGAARVTGHFDVPYAPWGVAPEPNRGLEGICHAPPYVVVASEVTPASGPRRAPVAAYHRETGALAYGFLPLRTPKGKISALDCAMRGDGIAFVAVERHYEDRRVLAGKMRVTDTLDVDVTFDLPFPEGYPANPEGIVRDGDEVHVVSDNQYGRAPRAPALWLRLGPVPE